MQKILPNFKVYVENIDALISIGPNTTKELHLKDIFPIESEEHTIKGTLQLAKRIFSK
jgi:hypothetical protein